MLTFSITEARARFTEMVRKAKREVVRITDRNRPTAVILSFPMNAAFHKGDRVIRISDRTQFGTVSSEGVRMADTFSYRISLDNSSVVSIFENDLKPFTDEVDPGTLFEQRSFDGWESFLRLVTFIRLSRQLTDTFLTPYASGKVEFHAYQFRPLLKLLKLPESRILIADEVGLGKTIEACHILREFSARAGGLIKVLVLCPANLRRKWKSELANKFGEEFELWNGEAFQNWLSRGQELNYWGEVRAIVSYQSLSRDPIYSLICPNEVGKERQDVDMFAAEMNLDLDLLIADESAWVRNLNKTHGVVERLARVSKTVLFLSATPVQLGEQNLFNQMQILLPQRFHSEYAFQSEIKFHKIVRRAISAINLTQVDELKSALNALSRETGVNFDNVIESIEELNDPSDIVHLREYLEEMSPLGNVINRTRRRDLPEGPRIRKAAAYPHQYNENEQIFYKKIHLNCLNAPTEPARFGSQMTLRQAASCLPVAMAAQGWYASHKWDGDDVTEEWDEKPTRLSEMGIDVNRLINNYDSKFDEFIRALRERWNDNPSAKIVVFSFFVGTLEYLSLRIKKKGIKHEMVNGRIPADVFHPEKDERGKRYERFRDDPDVKLLLSSEVGAEGIDLQVADTIVNYDLPWNPMVVEQRIGRLDRRGQKSNIIYIINMVAQGTIEQYIIWRLYNRLKIFEQTIGDLEPILGEVISKLEREFFKRYLTPEEMQNLADQLAIAIEQNHLDQEQLESAAMTDLVITPPALEPMEEARIEGRVVTPKHLQLLVEDYMKKFAIESNLQLVHNGIWRIHIGQDLFTIIAPMEHKLCVPAERYVLGRALQSNQFQFAYEPQYAIRRDVELISASHFLIQAICQDLKQKSFALHPVSAVEITTDIVSIGIYAYGLYYVEFKGLHIKRHLLPIFYRLNHGELNLITPKDSHILVSEILLKGRSLDWRIIPIIQEVDINDVCQKIRDQFYYRLESDFEQFTKGEELIRKSRIRSEESYTDAKLKNLQVSLDNARLHHPRIVPLVEGQIRAANERLNRVVGEINKNAPNKNHEELGFGLLHVVSG